MPVRVRSSIEGEGVVFVSDVEEQLLRELLKTARGLDGPPELVAVVEKIEAEEERARLLAQQSAWQAQIDAAQAKLAALGPAPRVRRARRG